LLGGEPSVERFAVQLRDLVGYLHDALPPNHPASAVRATPMVPTVPELWMLGSTDGGASYASYFGLAFSFAHFINSSGVGPRVMAQYRAQFQRRLLLTEPRGSVAIRVVCADTEQEAIRLASEAALVRSRMRRREARAQGVPPLDEVLAQPPTDQERAEVQESLRSAAVGAPEQVRARLEQVAVDYGVDELLVLTICQHPMARRRSYELLAEVCASAADQVQPVSADAAAIHERVAARPTS
jgi:luciferase family oxidoreductase group 1